MIIPTDLTSFLELIRQHGDAAYSLMFAYAASHSLLFGMFAGYAAHAGALNLGTLFAVCWIGSFCGDVIRFWIGRRFGIGWLSSYPRIKRTFDTAVQLVDRHHIWMILLHRFLPPAPRMRLGAFDKKSRSTTNWPILACSFSTS